MRRTVAIVLVAVGFGAAVTLLVRSAKPTADTPVSALPPLQTSVPGIPAAWPTWWPTPQVITTRETAVAYAVALLGNPRVVRRYAARSTGVAIMAMQNGGVAEPSPKTATEEEEFYRSLWIVGLELEEPLASWYLERATGMGEGLGESLYPEVGGRVVYITLDDLGNPMEGGFVDFFDEHGTPLPIEAEWQIEDIGSLPPAPEPSATP